MAVLSRTFFSQASCYSVVLQPHGCVTTVMVWALPRSLATTRGIINLFSLPAGTKMFQFPAFALCYCIVTVLQTAGLSHSEILGSMVICTYPKLIAAYHVLHRLQEPRHPPYALSYLLTRHILLRAVSAESCTLRFSCFLNLYGFTFIAFICSYSFEIALEESCVVQYVKDHVQRFRCFVWRISDSNR